MAYALAANADYCITGDRDFVEAPAIGNTQIVSVSQFLRSVEENEEDQV